MRTKHGLKVSGPEDPVTQHRIIVEWNPQLHHCINLKNHLLLLLLLVVTDHAI